MPTRHDRTELVWKKNNDGVGVNIIEDKEAMGIIDLLRRRGWKAGVTAQDHAWHGRVEQCHYCEEMHAETYGPPPEGCKR